MKRAALYIRVSTDEQARHGLSLGEQRADLEHYAQVHHYTIVDVYADQGNTARKAISKRKELQRLLDDVRADKIDIIIFKCLDRWFRNIRDYYKVQDILDEHGVDWECTQEKYNTTTTNGRLMLNIKLSVAQNESDQTSDRIRYVNEGKLRRHEALGGKCAYGYCIRNKRYAVDESKAEIVRYIYQRAIAGESPRMVAQEIFDCFNEVVSVRQVRCIMQNPAYIGTYHGIPDYHVPIIDKDSYMRVHAIMKRHTRPTKHGNIYLFRGKIICPSCGGILVAHMVRTKKNLLTPAYYCGRRNISGPVAGKGKCEYGGGIRETVIESWIVKNMSRLIASYFAEFESRSAGKGYDIEKKKKSINGKLNRMKELYIDGMIEKTEFLSRAADYQNQLDELSIQQDRCRTPSQAAQEIRGKIDSFQEGYKNLDRKHRQELWQRLILRIEIEGRPRPNSGESYSNFKVTFA